MTTIGRMKRLEAAVPAAVLALALFAGSAAPAGAWQPPAPQSWPMLGFLGAPGGSFLGVNVMEVNAERAKQLGLKETHGVELTRVEPDSPAGKAGLKKGDVVLSYNGQRVEGTEQFIRMVRETPSGRQVALEISREGAGQTVNVTMGARRGFRLDSERTFTIPRIEIPEIRLPDMPRAFMSWRSSMLGIEGESLDSQLAEYFGVKEGVLVRHVNTDSPAGKAGVKAGDVIVKIDNSKVSTPHELSSAIRSLPSRSNFPVTLVRERREMTLSVAVEESSPGGPDGEGFIRGRHIGVGNPRM